MRLSAAILLALAASACGQAGGDELLPKGETVLCSLGGARDFKAECQLDRSVVEGAQVFIVRHPDGAFRRLEVSEDGQNLLAADGADQTQSALKEGRYEVILGPDRYVIPAEADAAAQ